MWIYCGFNSDSMDLVSFFRICCSLGLYTRERAGSAAGAACNAGGVVVQVKTRSCDVQIGCARRKRGGSGLAGGPVTTTRAGPGPPSLL